VSPPNESEASKPAIIVPGGDTMKLLL